MQELNMLNRTQMQKTHMVALLVGMLFSDYALALTDVKKQQNNMNITDFKQGNKKVADVWKQRDNLLKNMKKSGLINLHNMHDCSKHAPMPALSFGVKRANLFSFSNRSSNKQRSVFHSSYRFHNINGMGGATTENISILDANTKNTNKKPVELTLDPLENEDMIANLAAQLDKKANNQPIKTQKNTDAKWEKPGFENFKKVKDAKKRVDKKPSLSADKFKQNNKNKAEETDSITLLTNKTLAEREKKYNKYASNKNFRFKTYNKKGTGLLAIRPVANAKITSKFGYRRIFGRSQFHKGVDLAAPYGTPIRATGAGKVTYAGWVRGYGRFIEIDHGNGLKTRYAHSARLRVKRGDYVKANQHISDLGCSGRCTGPHLHYEVKKNGKRVNPMIYIAAAPRS